MGKIKLKHGTHEIELEGDDNFIKSQLEAFYKRVGSMISSTTAPQLTAAQILSPTPQAAAGPAPTPAEFYRLKSRGKTDGITQLLIFAKFLETYKNLSEFSQKDVNAIVKEARLSKDIHGQYFSNAVKQGLLRSLGSGRYSLTLSAEELIAS
jgi:hypothetical protein